jgi:hypothetical protein
VETVIFGADENCGGSAARRVMAFMDIAVQVCWAEQNQWQRCLIGGERRDSAVDPLICPLLMMGELAKPNSPGPRFLAGAHYNHHKRCQGGLILQPMICLKNRQCEFSSQINADRALSTRLSPEFGDRLAPYRLSGPEAGLARSG